jgi:hypothetical protein
MTQTATQLNAKQACACFGISNMTLLSWRKGTKSRTALPVAQPKKSDTRPTIRFNVAGIKAWAKKNAVEFVMTPEQVLESDVTTVAVKPGPKQRATAVSA